MYKQEWILDLPAHKQASYLMVQIDFDPCGPLTRFLANHTGSSKNVDMAAIKADVLTPVVNLGGMKQALWD